MQRAKNLRDAAAAYIKSRLLEDPPDRQHAAYCDLVDAHDQALETPDDLTQYLEDHAVTVGQSCEPGWHIYLNSDDETVPLSVDHPTEHEAEKHARQIRAVLAELLREYRAHLIDLGVAGD